MIFEFLHATLLPFLTIVAALFGARHLTRGHRPEGHGALAASAVLGLSALAEGLELDAWLEGGWWMGLVAMSGAYAVGSAVASRLTRAPGPRRAALVALGLTLAFGGAVRWYEVAEAREVVQHAAPEDRDLILEGASREAWRPVQFAGLLAGLTALLLMGRRTTRAALMASAADVASARAADRTHVPFAMGAR